MTPEYRPTENKLERVVGIQVIRSQDSTSTLVYTNLPGSPGVFTIFFPLEIRASHPPPSLSFFLLCCLFISCPRALSSVGLAGKCA